MEETMLETIPTRKLAEQYAAEGNLFALYAVSTQLPDQGADLWQRYIPHGSVEDARQIVKNINTRDYEMADMQIAVLRHNASKRGTQIRGAFDAIERMNNYLRQEKEREHKPLQLVK